MMRVVLVCCWLAAHFRSTTSLKQSLLNPPWKHCVHNLHAKRGWQEFVSPGYPHGITTQTQCSWIISSNPNYRIKLAFHTLNLTGSINSCFTQFVDIWDLKSGTSMGRFCGDQRPGDYVTYGYMTRVDLKADTAAPGHEGFMMKYKFTKEPGGFKQTHSFQHIPKPQTRKPNPKIKNKPVQHSPNDPKKPQKASVFDGKGGRVNLHLRQKLREKGSRKSPGSQRAPQSIYRPAQTRPIQRHPNRHLANREKTRISIDGGKDSFELWILIVIGVGVLLFLLFLGFLTWLCFCRKRRRTARCTVKATTKTSLSTGQHHELPGMSPLSPQRMGSVPSDRILVQTPNVLHPALTPRQPLPISTTMEVHRAPSASHLNQRSTNDPTSDNKINSVELQQQMVAPFGVNYIKYVATNRSMDNSCSKHELNHRNEKSQTQPHQIKVKKQVPTLKRKFCQWEKDEIKKGTIKF